MLVLNLLVVVMVIFAALTAAKPVTVTQKVLQMDDKDKIVGYTTHSFVRDSESAKVEAPIMPVPPTNTDPALSKLFKSSFPVGSPNITVTEPWQKKAETCSWQTDAYLIHHFEDTVFYPTNDLCSLEPGAYTWIVTDDYQISFGKFANTYEFTSKHANLALMRTGFVAGEVAVLPATATSKEMIYWNLLSGTYSIPISENQNPDDPMAYLEKVLFPKINAAFATLPCAGKMKYSDQNELFPDVLPSNAYVQDMCANNYYVKYENALTWKVDGKSVCTVSDSAAPCSIY